MGKSTAHDVLSRATFIVVAKGVVRSSLTSSHFPKSPESYLQNAMTSSEESTSAKAEGYRTERSLMDC